MGGKPSKQQLLDSIARDDRGTDADRRRILQSGAIAALASAVGLGGLVGTTSASSQSDDFEVVQQTASRTQLADARPLLAELAARNLLPRASPSAFPDAPLGTNDSGSAVFRYGDRTVHAFVRRDDGTKLTLNCPENGSPYALYAPDGSGPGTRVRFDQHGTTIETTRMEYTRDVTPASECDIHCGGSTCSPAGNCWWERRECVESCRSDGAGGYYCHDDCSCGC